jgi:hypothetical protein
MPGPGCFFHSVGTACASQGSRIRFGTLLCAQQMLFEVSRRGAVARSVGALQDRPGLNLRQSFSRKAFYLQQFLPGGKESMTLAMINNPVRNVLRDSGKLSQFLN